jgi:hypothetical protein
MKPGLRRLLHWPFFVSAAFGTLVVLFYAEEDWRGARAWAAVKCNLQARGETLDFNDFIPPPIPDDQNLAMAPLFKRLFQYKVDPRTHVFTFASGSQIHQTDTVKLFASMAFGPDNSAVSRPVFSSWMTGHALDLGAAQKYFQQRHEFPHAAQPQAPADDVLLALTPYAPLLDELALASAERPLTRFPVNYTLRPPWRISVTHYSYIQLLVRTLSLRAVAELNISQPPAARRDIMQTLRLRQTMDDDPLLIAPLVDCTCISILMQAVWEGLAARLWSANDLDTLRGGLQGIDVLREYQQAIRADRAIMAARWPEDLQNWASAREMTEVLPSLSDGQIAPSSLSLERWLWSALPYWPRGWYEQNAALACRYFQEDWIDTVDAARHRVVLARNKATEQTLKNIPLTPDTLLVKVTLPVLASIAERFAQVQTILDQAVIACALEKYYLERRTYPPTLSELAPGYLDRIPNDVMDGAPMRYRLTVDGRYQLYSIGWNGKDDGGAIVWPPDRQWRRAASTSPAKRQQQLPIPSRNEGDWVWQYAPAEPPDPPDNLRRLGS